MKEGKTVKEEHEAKVVILIYFEDAEITQNIPNFKKILELNTNEI